MFVELVLGAPDARRLLAHRTAATILSVVLVLVLLVMVMLLRPGPAGAQAGSADLAVDLAIVDDTTGSQVVRVRLTNLGPGDSSFPIATVAVDGAAITDHDADPQPGSRADGVGCELSDGATQLSCSWDVIRRNSAETFDVVVAVEGPASLSVRAEPAGTPDPNPGANNSASVALRPATAHLAITDVEVLAGTGPSEVEVATTIAHQDGRETPVMLLVEPEQVIDLTGPCEPGLDEGWVCEAGTLAPGEETTVVVALDRPEPGEDPLGLTLTVSAEDLVNPDPTAASATIDVDPRAAVAGQLVRHAGQERTATAVAISQARFAPDAAGAVVLARADAFADALAGGPLASDLDAPILLTPPGQLATGTLAEIDRVLRQGSTIHLLGGTAALSEEVARQVADAGYDVVRSAGPNRYGTAVAVWEALGRPRVVAAADGDTHADAVVAGAAMAAADGALLLTSGDRVPAELEPLAGQVDWAVGRSAAEALPAAVALHGSTAAATGVAVAEAFFTAPDAVGLATAEAFPDALAGGPLTAGFEGPLLLTDGDRVSREVEAYLEDTPTVVTAHLLGGTAALSTDVERGIADLLAR